ncbi:hypothetical protein ACFOQM_01170 [Paenibacillus sp. GCM10012307]|uniref:TIGR03986 family CRISPR-associated RAMP protein n=1 Tax=Paenibacillus roseus TaxID=2798579 RepID=A0A934MP00_9BACL|nr:hypothetical protein [Paenibacillus roseus]MBJ6359934.1 hypothetical protein [Paenibacillus roseus]
MNYPKKNFPKDRPIPLTLPYDFIPFPGASSSQDDNSSDKYLYPYTVQNVPKHDEGHGGRRLSGTISYTIQPHGELALEMRTRADGSFFLSGSQLRGKVRSNVEILSASYPEFIDRSEMVYRDIASGRYRQILLSENEKSKGKIEENVHAGYLMKRDQTFYIIPAKPIGNKNFISVKEHWLIYNSPGLLDKNNQLYNWGASAHTGYQQEMEKLQKKIGQLTEQIKVLRFNLRDKLDSDTVERMSDVFLRHFNLNKSDVKKLKSDLKNQPYDESKAIEEIEILKRKLTEKLNKVVRYKSDFSELISKSAERWGYKARIDIYYSFLKSNKDFKPYEEPVSFSRTEAGSLVSIGTKGEELGETGYLFNSANAVSKRSHYLINNPNDDKEIEVPSNVVWKYNQLLKEQHTEDDFYNIFDKYDKLSKCKMPGGKNKEIIVFYQEQERCEKDQGLFIGRTPYFKVAYDHQLSELLKDSNSSNIDYARAMFGYVSQGENKDVNASAYKSRLRFSPIDIVSTKGELDVKTRTFLLASPSATAAGMYLQPKNDRRAKYEKEVEDNKDKKEESPRPKLNGYKYYHILPKIVEYQPEKKTKNIESARQIVRPEGVRLQGKIYFSNLFPSELGLLILGLDMKRLLDSEEYKDDVKRHQNDIKNAYELIGGAKPYGYGKVRISIESIKLEKQGNDFVSLITKPDEDADAVQQISSYIDACIQKLGGGTLFKTDRMDKYICSKQETSFDNKATHINWSTIKDIGPMLEKYKVGSKQVGYPKTSYLKSKKPNSDKDGG